MTVLFWIFVFFFGSYWVFRLFGRQISQFVLQRVARRLLKDMEQKHQAYQRNYDDGNMRTNVYVDQEIKVSAPKSASKKAVSADEIAEDIEYEEVY